MNPLGLWLIAGALAQGDPASVQADLDARRFGDAWSAASAVTDPLLRSRLQSAVLFRAGDHAGALATAREGLAREPSDLELLQRAAAAGIWLRDPATASELAARLRTAVEGAQLEPEQRSGWEREARDLAGWAGELATGREARKQALARARGVAFTLLAGALAFLVWCGARTIAAR